MSQVRILSGVQTIQQNELHFIVEFVFIDIMRLNPPLQLFLPNPVRIYLSSLDTPMTKEFK